MRTFKAICELGDFTVEKSTAPAKVKPKPKPKAQDADEVPLRELPVKTREIADGLTVNINVQLQVPPDATGEIYDKFFEAMRKHLWPLQK